LCCKLLQPDGSFLPYAQFVLEPPTLHITLAYQVDVR
jgi:hypothetical protein